MYVCLCAVSPGASCSHGQVVRFTILYSCKCILTLYQPLNVIVGVIVCAVFATCICPQAHQELTDSPYFFLDVLYAHEQPSGRNLCEVGGALGGAERTISYTMTVGKWVESQEMGGAKNDLVTNTLLT